VIIDVSQAVDLDHPKALDFLREDSRHINDFFRRAGVAVLTGRELFDYVVDATITPENEEEALAALQQVAARCGLRFAVCGLRFAVCGLRFAVGVGCGWAVVVWDSHVYSPSAVVWFCPPAPLR